MNLTKSYSPQEFEDQIYKQWEESGFFNPDNLNLPKDAPIFSVMMPPPNVTGILHLGHALENSLMDLQIRYQRMLGKRALLVPGTDHAAVATQAKVEKDLIRSGKYKNPRTELGRERLLEIIREYAENSKATILKQIRKMGTSCDWSRLAYTFDKQREKAVNEMFVRMYNDGLIYRGSRLINWDPKIQTTISDDEIVWEEETVPLYYIQYGPFVIATARPETKFGDKYVVMHPKDKRYSKYKHGDTFECEWINGKIKATVIKDEVIDREFGTGAMTITPWHDATDFELSQKHHLSMEQIINLYGKLMPVAGEFAGMKILEARPKIVEKLREKGLLVKVDEKYTHRVAKGDRSGGLIEPQILKQWFIDVNKKISDRDKSLKELMKEVFTTGLNSAENQKIKITPERFEKIYFNWIHNLRDWCISRQIWWGHRIPVWYKQQTTNNKQPATDNNTKEEIYVGTELPKGNNWIQDEDTLDTWFSSGLWSFSTLGWPDKTEDLKKFHPTSWMQMGYEILFFWMARMILMSSYALKEIPFKEVYIHGILRDIDNKKFSKSLGNGIDPIEMSNKYGTDALRMSLISGIAPGNDARFYEDKLKNFRNFANKIWNIGRFIQIMGNEEQEPKVQDVKPETLSDKWVMSRFNNLIKEITDDLNNSRFSLAAEKLYEFTWHELADWYIEIAKIQNNKNSYQLLATCYLQLLKLIHPFMPFITEVIYQSFYNNKILMVERYPEVSPDLIDEKSETAFENIKKIIVAIRTLRMEKKVEPKEIINILISAPINEVDIIEALTKVKIKINPELKNHDLEIAELKIKFDK